MSTYDNSSWDRSPADAASSRPAEGELSPANAIRVAVEVEALRSGGLASLGAGPYVLEIGFGRGELLLAAAAEDPQRTFVGLEISRKRVRKMARRVERAELSNVRLLHAPAQYVLERALPAKCLEECWIHCPDPWPKRRHHGRRLIQARTAELLARVLEPGGRLYLSTDDPAYAEWIDGVFSRQPAFANLFAPHRWSWEAPARPRTGYEEDWIADGRAIAYFAYARRDAGEPHVASQPAREHP